MAKPARARLATLPSLPALRLETAPPPPKETAPIYSTAEYRKWRAAVLQRAGYRCEDCPPGTPRTGKLYADHVSELADGGAPFDLANGRARCASCHVLKTNRARSDRQKA